MTHYRQSTRGRRDCRKRLNLIPIDPVPSYRLRLVFAILCLGLFSLLGRMGWLQVMQASMLQARARAAQTYVTKPLGIRRSIVDRNGRLVAFDEEHFRLWAHPKYFQFPGDSLGKIRTSEEVVQKISQHLSLSKNELILKLGNRASGVRVVDGLSKEVAQEIKKLGISGLDLEPYLQRVYPQGSLFANVVGFVNHDRLPQAGLELSLNKKLLRKEKVQNLRHGADGTPLPSDLAPGVFRVDDLRLHLTLDARLQELSAKALQAEVERWRAEKGVAIVMDTSNGEILALASTPTYDPNSYWKYSPSLFREWSVQDLFEPGSTFKPINLALALEEEVIDANGAVYDSGKVVVGGWSIYNHDRKPNGLINYAKVLQVSSNVGMVNVMRKLEPSRYWDWLYRLGLNASPNTDLPGAVAGRIKPKELFIKRPIEPAVASYGQGFSLTPLKLLQLHALIANDGQLVDPHITKGLSNELKSFSSAQVDRTQILSQQTTKIVQSWMESVVEGGSGNGVQKLGYRIGGKTGTAQKAHEGTYKPGARICSFVATLPMDDPKFAILVVVDEPKGENAYGSTVALPVAREIIDGLLVLEKIPPSLEKPSFHKLKG